MGGDEGLRGGRGGEGEGGTRGGLPFQDPLFGDAMVPKGGKGRTKDVPAHKRIVKNQK